MTEKANLNILVIRPDRIGDVILSTPVFDVLKRHYPRSRITVMVREAVAPVIRGLPSVDEVLVFDPDGRHAGVEGFFRLMKDIRERRFRIAVALQANMRIAAAVFGTGVRYRVGPLSKLYSFFFFNRGVRQRRSMVEMHESDYNLQLLRRLGVRVGTRNVPTRVSVSDEAREFGRAWLEKHGFTTGAGEKLVVVHPGMGGSALNWPESHYLDLMRLLIKDGRRILVTGGPGEGGLLDRIREQLGAHADKAMFYGGPGTGPVDHLGGLFSWGDLVIAPSTGPLHLAVALGKPVVSFYPPIRVQSALRWGPYLRDESRASILFPEVYCGEDFKCRGSLCHYFPCMKTITVPQALEESRRQLTQSNARGEQNG